ncbi:MAG: hypothetical protein JXR96_22575 [Deltaproteobacteria bacterium]|nr:hypothetical protein [Deltaproteobacteria bacterium]
MRHLTCLSALTVMLCSVSATAAEAEKAKESAFELTPFLEWRYIASHAQDFPLNAAGEVSGLNWYVDQRLDFGGEVKLGDLAAGTEIELFYGQVAGEFDHVGADLRPDARETLRGWDLKNAELRQLWVDWTTPWFKLKAGQMGSHWGLGMLARDGRTELGRINLPDQGDLSDRILIATRPLASLWPDSWPGRIAVAVGGGVVYRDENCELRAGDLGGEVIGSIFYSQPGAALGVYAAGRIQKDDPGTRLDVVAIDLFGNLEPLPGKAGPVLAAELALITGSTNRLITAEQPDGVDVLAFGAVGRAGWQFARLGLRAELELGYASGDPEPGHGRMSTFSFDPDYKVGLVLFDTVLRGVSAMGAQEAADPERVGEPLPGTDQIASRGRVQNAVYAFPQVRIQPVEQLTLMTGLVWAWSAVEFSQSYQTFMHGGVATNPYGLTGAGRELGVELDVGMDWKQPIWSGLYAIGGIQTGWFFPGKAFERPDGSRPPITARVLARVALGW